MRAKLPKKRPQKQRVLHSTRIIEHKNQGNDCFKGRKYSEAESNYTSALDLVDKDLSHNTNEEEAQEESVDLWVLYSNRAMTRLKLGKPDLAFQDATSAHVCAPQGAVKPIVRYAQCLNALGMQAEALQIIVDYTDKSDNGISPEDSSLLKEAREKIESRECLRVGPTQDFKTISAALATAKPNAEILVDAGLYQESLEIYQPVTIRATVPPPEDILQPTKQPTGKPQWAEIRSPSFFNAINVLQDSQEWTVCIIGFRIVAASQPSQWSWHAVTSETSTVIVRKCSLSSSCGPVVCSGTKARIIFDDSAVHDGSEGGILAADNGVVVLRRTQVCYNAAAGLELRSGGSAIVEECEFFENGRQGVLVWKKAGAFEAENSEIHSHECESGVKILENHPYTAELRDCEIHSNGMAGVTVEHDGFVKLRNCEVTENHEGLFIQGKGGCDVRKCSFSNNRSNGIFVGFDHKSASVTIMNNRLEGNQLEGLRLGTGHKKCLRLEGNEEVGNKGVARYLPSKYLQRVQESGLVAKKQLRFFARRLQKRSTTNTFGTTESDVDALLRKAAERFLSCAFCEKPAPEGVRFLKCGRCMALSYCSKVCQTKHWKNGHKQECTPVPEHPSFVDPSLSV